MIATMAGKELLHRAKTTPEAHPSQVRLIPDTPAYEEGILRLAAIPLLPPDLEDVPAVEQVRRIENAKGLTPREKRVISVAWAKPLVRERSDGEFEELASYFLKENDTEALSEIALVKFRDPQKNSSSI
jgi:hypothetical protein